MTPENRTKLAGFESMNPINKIELRKNLINRRLSLKTEQIEEDSVQIKRSLVTLLHSLDVCTVGLYYPVRQEPELLSICETATLTQITWCLPRCNIQDDERWLDFLRYRAGDQLVDGLYRIPVPAVQEIVLPDCLIIPCVAFNNQGARLGYGAGWYDRTLEKFKPKYTIGVAYDWSEVPDQFQEAHDIRLNYVVTPSRVVRATFSA